MKTVKWSVFGGAVQTKQVEQGCTVADLKEQLNLTNYTATIGGEPAGDEDTLRNNDVVVFTQAVKGGC